MTRTTLSDAHWARLCEAITRCAAYKTENLRTAIEGILWRHRTGAPWRDLPREFGPWKTIYNRFNEWSKNGIWETLFDCIKSHHEADNEWNFMDGTYVRAHQHASGGIEPLENKTIGLSRGGNTSKVHMLGDAHGNPITFEITGGNSHDVTKGEALLSKSIAENIIADKGYDADYLRDAALLKQMVPHIPRKSNSSKPNLSFDKFLYRHRHLIENLFARLKHNRAFATRYDKLTRNFAATVFISCMLVWLKL